MASKHSRLPSHARASSTRFIKQKSVKKRNLNFRIDRLLPAFLCARFIVRCALHQTEITLERPAATMVIAPSCRHLCGCRVVSIWPHAVRYLQQKSVHAWMHTIGHPCDALFCPTGEIGYHTPEALRHVAISQGSTAIFGKLKNVCDLVLRRACFKCYTAKPQNTSGGDVPSRCTQRYLSGSDPPDGM